MFGPHLRHLSLHLLLPVAGLTLLCCKGGPEEREIIPVAAGHGTVKMPDGIDLDMHEIRVLETLPTDSYLYLRVREDGRDYWIATTNRELRQDETYFYNEALMRTDFRSEALDRSFDTLYLVTRIVPEAERKALETGGYNPHSPQAGMEAPSGSAPFHSSARPVSIAELLEQPADFADQWVRVEGRCERVNYGILGRNWVHLKTEAGEELVVTTQDSVPLNAAVGMRGIVRLDRDFGSGYTYALLLEEGALLP